MICTPTCGDMIKVATETCEWDSITPVNGCDSSSCQESSIYSVCDGDVPVSSCVVCGDGLNEGEACDDGNNVDSDGCTSTCTVESGWICDSASPTFCKLDCGEGNYLEEGTGSPCLACHGTCKTCNGATSNDCLSCFDGFVLDGSDCVIKSEIQ